MQKILRTFLTILFLVTAVLPAKALEVVTDIPENPSSALVIIHGYRRDGVSMRWLGEKLKKDFSDMAFYYPTAPDKAISTGWQWFILPGVNNELIREDTYGLMLTNALHNAEYLNELIDEIHTTQNIPYEKINVAGFSQGGLMTVLTGLTNKHKLGKMISFSGVPLLNVKELSRDVVHGKPETLIIQGDSDPVIPKDSYQMTADTLTALGVPNEIKIIKGMNHRIGDETIPVVVNFLRQ